MLSLLFIFAVGCQATGSIEVLEFADDSENETESLSSSSSAVLNIADVPPMFTMCSALMVNEWKQCFFGCFSNVLDLTWENDGTSLQMGLKENRKNTFLRFRMDNSTWYEIKMRVFHRAWIRICVSIDRILNLVQVSTDGRKLNQVKLEGAFQLNGTSGLIVSLGRRKDDKGRTNEYNVTISQMNYFSSSLSVKRSKEMAPLESKFCRIQGDLLRKDVIGNANAMNHNL